MLIKSDNKNFLSNTVILDKFNYVWIVSGFFMGAALILLIYLFYKRDGFIKMYDGAGIFCVALYPLITAFFINFKLKITPQGIQPQSIVKRDFIKWDEIKKITWRVGVHYSKHGINVGTYNIVKIITNKKSIFNRTVRYKMWDEKVSREMEKLLYLVEKEKGIEVRYYNTLS